MASSWPTSRSPPKRRRSESAPAADVEELPIRCACAIWPTRSVAPSATPPARGSEELVSGSASAEVRRSPAPEPPGARGAAPASRSRRPLPPPALSGESHRRPSIASRTTRRISWWTAWGSAKRTSHFAGCTFTSTLSSGTVRKTTARGEASPRQHVAIGVQQRAAQHAVAHRSIVDEEIHAVAAVARDQSRRGQDRPARGRRRSPHSTGTSAAASCSESTAAMRVEGVCGCGPDERPRARRGGAAKWMSGSANARRLSQSADVPPLGAGLLQELASRRYRAEEIGHLDCGCPAVRLAAFSSTSSPPSMRISKASESAWRGRVTQTQAGDRRDCGQRLAAESKARHAQTDLRRFAACSWRGA